MTYLTYFPNDERLKRSAFASESSPGVQENKQEATRRRNKEKGARYKADTILALRERQATEDPFHVIVEQDYNHFSRIFSFGKDGAHTCYLNQNTVFVAILRCIISRNSVNFYWQ